MYVVSDQELHLSSKLYGLLGQLSAEISQLPNERTINTWTQTETLHAICRAKDALIDVLRCAIRLSELGELDQVSRQWMAEALICSEKDQSLLDRVEEVLLNGCAW